MAGITQPAIRSAESTQQNKGQIGWLWVAATAVPAIIICVVLNLLILTQVNPNPERDLSGDNGILPALEYVGMLLLSGIAIALAQCWVLRKSFAMPTSKQVGWIITWLIGRLPQYSHWEG